MVVESICEVLADRVENHKQCHLRSRVWPPLSNPVSYFDGFLACVIVPSFSLDHRITSPFLAEMQSSPSIY